MQFVEPDAYQPLAHRLFDEIAARLREQLPAARIEHIGASAVHGALSKGDLDVFVAVKPEEFEQAVSRIASLGFSIKPDSLRTDELCPFESTAHPLDVGVQLIASRSRFEFFLAFRDALNADASLVRAYNALKVSCVGLEHDEYRRRKSVFIESVLAAPRA